jgi:hypothetical protein
MIGDMERLLKRGDRIKMFVMGKSFEVEVLATDITEYERKYLISFSNIPGDTKWVSNSLVRQFLFCN